MSSMAEQWGSAADADAFALPDFLDLAGPAPAATFACSSSAADGGVLVFPDHLVLVTGGGSAHIPVDEVRSWSIQEAGEVCVIAIECAQGVHKARIAPAFVPPTASALEAAVGHARAA